MGKVNFNPLEPHLVKPSVRVRLKEEDYKHKRQTTETVPPVVYHGTCRFSLLFWQNQGMIHNPRLSTSFMVTKAAAYAAYYLSPKEGSPHQLVLRNGQKGTDGRRVDVFLGAAEQFGLMDEYRQIQQGNIVQSLTFFDRDALLEGRGKFWGVEHEIEGGLCVRQDKDYPRSPKELLKALFAAMHYHPREDRIVFAVFDPLLWQANFSCPPPSPYENVSRLFRRTLEEFKGENELRPLMHCIAQRFIRGKKLGEH